jgi:hypothetical protein
MSIKKSQELKGDGLRVKRVIVFMFILACLIVVLKIGKGFLLQKNTSQNTLSVSGVLVKDFTKDIENPNDKSFITIVQTESYHIFFIPNQSLFYISVIQSPFEKYKDEAEQKLLEVLDIEKVEACGLKVDITTPNSANPNHSGQIYNLSFCSNQGK